MSESIDYSKLTDEELSAAKKKIKNSELMSSVLIGFLAGIIIFGVAMNGFGFLYVVIPVVLILGIIKHSNKQKSNLKRIQEELDSRNNE